MLAFALALSLLVFLLACVAMMTVFMGGTDLGPLLALLALSLPVTLAMAISGTAWFTHRHGASRGLRQLWRSIPQWQAVACWLAIALIFCGELALIITLRLAEVPPAPWQHLPLAAGLSAALAFVVVDAVRCARAANRQ